MSLNGQQWVFKHLVFIGTAIGVVADGTNIVFVGCRFENGEIGIEATGTSGSLTVIDTNSTGLGTLINSYNSSNAGNSIILENVLNFGNTVTFGGTPVLVGDVTETWIHGDLVSR
jgi:glucan 1,3-beta-glucosidase